MASQGKEWYTRQLQSPLWQKKRLEIFNRDEFACRRCKSKEKELHLHHNYYEVGRQAWEYPDDCYQTLCYECHEFEEKNKSLVDIVKDSISKRNGSYKNDGDGWLESNDYFKVCQGCRVDRLICVFDYAESKEKYLANHIDTMNDHKGCLSVYWRIIPTEDQKRILKDAWEEQNECEVEHFLANNPFEEDIIL